MYNLCIICNIDTGEKYTSCQNHFLKAFNGFEGIFLLRNWFLLLLPLVLRRIHYWSTINSCTLKPHKPKSRPCQHPMPLNCTSVWQPLKHSQGFFVHLVLEFSSKETLPYAQMCSHLSSLADGFHTGHTQLFQFRGQFRSSNQVSIVWIGWKLEMALQATVIIVMQNTAITWVCFTELLAEENYWQKNHRQFISYMDIHRELAGLGKHFPSSLHFL